MISYATNTHLLHESIVLVIERIVVVQVIIAAISMLLFAIILGITDSPGLFAATLASVALQTLDAVLITKVILNWERISFFITPHEIVVRQGVIETKEKAYTYDDIESIEISQDALGKVFNYGSIYFYSLSAKEEVGITNISRPLYYYEIIKEFKEKFDAKHAKAKPKTNQQEIS